MAQMVKNLPAVQETQVPSLGQEDSLEKEVVTHFSILALKIPWTEYLETKESDMENLTQAFQHFCIVA